LYFAAGEMCKAKKFCKQVLLRIFCFAKRNPPPQCAHWGTSFQKEAFGALRLAAISLTSCGKGRALALYIVPSLSGKGKHILA
jgi:hypothetical protein